MKERVRFARSSSTALAALVLLSCHSSEEPTNELQGQVQSALDYSGVRSPSMTCLEISRERTGVCFLEASKSDFRKIVANLHLEPVRRSNVSFTVNGEGPRKDNRFCATRPEFAEGHQTEQFHLGNKAPIIRKATKARLESLTLVRAEKTKLVCIVLSYAYG